jgi:hypothetical protein
MDLTGKGRLNRSGSNGRTMKVEYLSCGCESHPTKAKTRRSVASLATPRVTATVIRRHARV